MICCDYCASSFHLACHDPPLEESDIPMGLWLCHTCTMKEKIEHEKEKLEQENVAQEIVPKPESLESSSGIGSEPLLQELPAGVVVADVEMKEPESLTSEIDLSPMQIEGENIKEEKVEVEFAVQVEVKAEEKEEPPVEVKEPEEIALPVLSPFEELIRVASLLNPKQFELPSEMVEPFPFPGTERVESIRNGRRVKNKRLIELDSHGCVPLPAKLCFACNKSCKRAPLISCDYCTLYFHQDCLDPPMTALPAGRWMCPNHPQHFIVSLNFKILKFF